MTKKKHQRKGRSKKEAEREPTRRQLLEDAVRATMQDNERLQQWNTKLEPLYAIMTGLELKTQGVNETDLLQNINLQDYDYEYETSCEYSIDFKLSMEEFYELQITVSGVPIQFPRTVLLEQIDGECRLTASFRYAGVKYYGTFADISGCLGHMLQQEGGSMDITDGFPLLLPHNTDNSIHLKSINICKRVLEAALTCDTKRNLHQLQGQELRCLEDSVACAKSDDISKNDSQFIESYVKTLHQSFVMKAIAWQAFQFCILGPDGAHVKNCPLQLGQFGTSKDAGFSWCYKMVRHVPLRHLHTLRFFLSGVPYKTLGSVTLEMNILEDSEGSDIFLVGNCFQVRYGEGIVLTFHTTDPSVVPSLRQKTPVECLPNEMVTLTSIEIVPRLDPVFQQRMTFLPAFLQDEGNILSMEDENDLAADFDTVAEKAMLVLTKYASI